MELISMNNPFSLHIVNPVSNHNMNTEENYKKYFS